MPYQIIITTDAEAELRALPVRAQRMIEAAVPARLVKLPTMPPRAVKRLRPNPLAELELRVRDLRVLYNVERTELPRSGRFSDQVPPAQVAEKTP